jgi:uncharacterized membrane protein
MATAAKPVNATLINIISTLAIIIPIVANSLILNTAGVHIRLFFIFLLTGFSNDLLGWYYSTHPEIETFVLYCGLLYSMIEAVFFLWMITSYPRQASIHKIRTYMLMVVLCWGVYLLYKGVKVTGLVSHASLFDVFYQVVVSFFAGFTLLHMAEKEERLTVLPLFWIFTGIFFYCFSTFFIFVMKRTTDQAIANELWKVHNACNIITYLFYTIGFWKFYKRRPPIIS